MGQIRRRGFTLSGRIALFLFIFTLALLTQIGLYNVAARLRLAGYAPGLEIVSEAGSGTRASMRLPLVLAAEEEEEETADE